MGCCLPSYAPPRARARLTADRSNGPGSQDAPRSGVGPIKREQYQHNRRRRWQNRPLVLTVMLDPMTLLDPMTGVTAVGDPSATRTVYVTTFALVALGIGLGVLTWWLFRRTRPEPELFAPLEEMDSRAWRKMSSDERREALEASRPIGARPVVRADDVETDPPDEDPPDEDPPEVTPETAEELIDATPAGLSSDVLAELSAEDSAHDDSADEVTDESDDEPTDEHPREAVDEAVDEPADESEREPAVPDGADGTRSSA
jgi:hypothetical protein